MTKITSLTPVQKDLMYSVQDEWTNNLITLKLDKDKIKKGLDFLYSEAGLKPPSLIVYVDSPLGMQYAYHILSNLKLKHSLKDSVNNSVIDSVINFVNNSVMDSIKDSVWNPVCDSVQNFIKESVDDSVWNSIRNSVYDYVSDSVCDSVQNFIKDSVQNSVSNSVCFSVRDSVWDSLYYSMGDSVNNKSDIVYQSVFSRGSVYDWYWVSYYDYFQRIGVKLTPKFSTFKDYCCLSGAYDYLLYKDCAIVCGMPSNIEWQTINEIKVASSTTGPSIEWSDGFKIYQIRGTRVPEHVVIAPHTITINEIQNEQNLEVRRIMIEQYGTENYLKDIKASIVDFDIHGINNGARILLQDSNDDKWLLVTDGSTDRLYTMAVDSDSNSCPEGHSSLCGFNENLIKLEG